MKNKNKQDSLALKEVGNTCFKEKKFQEAIQYYTQAIDLDPTNSIFFSNRSRCYKNLGRLEEASILLIQGYEDALKATELDQKNIKAHLLAGQILIGIASNEKQPEKVEKAIQKIKRSLSLCSSQGKREFESQLIQQIYRAKKKLWYLKLDRETQKKKALRAYLINLVQTDEDLSQSKKDTYNQKIEQLLNENIKTDKDPVPPELVCFISKKIMKDPVCNEHGNTYCRIAYLEYLKAKKQDPRTKKPIITNLLYPNLNIRKAIEDFLERNSWAYEQIIS